MKVAIVSYEYPPDTAFGGIATYTYQAARMLAQKGHEVELFVSSPKSNETIEEDGILVHKVLSVNRNEFKPQAARRFYIRHHAKAFDILEGPDFGADASECIRLVPDIPFTIRLHTPLFIVSEINKSKVKLTSQLRILASSILRFKNNFPRKYNRNLDPEYLHILKADVIAASSLAIANKLEKEWNLNKEIFDLVPLPFNPGSRLLEVNPHTNTKQILFLGRLEINKGVIELAKAIPIILKKFPEAKFKFIGRSASSPNQGVSMKDYLINLLKLNISSVEFIDQIPATLIPKYMEQVDICVFPSLWESYGFVCLEAMAAARGVVASDSGGMKEILDNGNAGILIPPKNPSKIAAAVIDLLENEEKRIKLGQLARERVLKYYNTEVIYNLHFNSYLRTIEEKRKRGSSN